jgi:curli production assembly/transport component CsgG
MGFSAGAYRYIGDYAPGPFKPKTSFLLGFGLNNHFSLDAEVGQRYLTIDKKVKDDSYFGDLSLRYIFRPYDKFTPWIQAGGGLDYNFIGVGSSKNTLLPSLNGAFGFEYMVGRKVSLLLSGGLNYYLDDKFDGAAVGWYNDFSWGISTGLKVYLGKLKYKNN